MKKFIGIILETNNYQSFINQNSLLIEELSKNFKNIYVINVIKLKFRQIDKEVLNENKFPRNFICKTIDNSKEFLNFFKDKEFIALQYLSKNPDFFKIFYLIKKANIKNIMIMNLGNFGNKQTIEWNNIKVFKAFGHFYHKGFYYLFRIFTILNIFPKVDILFECNNEIIENIQKGLSRRVENLIPFFQISYFRKIIQVNSIFYDHFVKNKKNFENPNDKILYIDTPLNHPDRVVREGKIDTKDIKSFYEKLTVFLTNISLTFNKEIIICLHPSNKDEKKYFKSFKISTNTTMDEIPSADIVIFTVSSAILNSVMYKKKIINIETKYLGKYLNNFRLKYVNALNLFNVNIDDDIKIEKKLFLEKMKNSINYYDNFIKTNLCSDKNITSNKKIIDTIKKEYF
jgi:hypothetical protein